MLDVQGVSDVNNPLSQNSYVIIVLLKCLFVSIPGIQRARSRPVGDPFLKPTDLRDSRGDSGERVTAVRSQTLEGIPLHRLSRFLKLLSEAQHHRHRLL